MLRIFYLCSGKKNCNNKYGTHSECSFVNPKGKCKHTNDLRYAKHPAIMPSEKNPLFKITGDILVERDDIGAIEF